MNRQSIAEDIKPNIVKFSTAGIKSVVTKITSNSLIEIGGQIYTGWELERELKKAKRLKLKGGENYCPLCECELAAMDLFVCTSCKTVLHNDDRCDEHREDGLCKSCCKECQDEKAYNDNTDMSIDLYKEDY